jgi:hypothetical protein
MYGCIRIQVIGDVKPYILPLTQADKWSRYTAIYGDTRSTPSFNDAMATSDGQIYNLAAQFSKAGRNTRTAAAVAAPVT